MRLPIRMTLGSMSRNPFPVPAGSFSWKDWTKLCGVLVVACLVGCRDAKRQAVLALERRGVAPTPAALVEALRQNSASLIGFPGVAGVKAGLPGPDGNPPLVRAAAAGHNGLVRRLLEKGASPGQPGALGQTAYQMAVLHRQSEAVDALLAAGAPPDDPFRKPAPPELLPLFGSDYFANWYQSDEGLAPLMLAAAGGIARNCANC